MWNGWNRSTALARAASSVNPPSKHKPAADGRTHEQDTTRATDKEPSDWTRAIHAPTNGPTLSNQSIRQRTKANHKAPPRACPWRKQARSEPLIQRRAQASESGQGKGNLGGGPANSSLDTPGGLGGSVCCCCWSGLTGPTRPRFFSLRARIGVLGTRVFGVAEGCLDRCGARPRSRALGLNPPSQPRTTLSSR